MHVTKSLSKCLENRERVMRTGKNTVLQHSVKCIIRIKKLKMPSFCINKRITEAVTLYKVHEKCSSSMKLFCLSDKAVLSWWLLLGASHSALRFVCCRCLVGERNVKE